VTDEFADVSPGHAAEIEQANAPVSEVVWPHRRGIEGLTEHLKDPADPAPHCVDGGVICRTLADTPLVIQAQAYPRGASESRTTLNARLQRVCKPRNLEPRTAGTATIRWHEKVSNHEKSSGGGGI